MFTHYLHTEIEIAASADRVWAVLSDLASYPQWNPFVRSAAGTLRQGERLQIVVQPDGGKAMRFSPVVLTVEPTREIRWLGRFLFPGLFDGEHSFVIESLGENKVRFIQNERFGGVLVGIMRRSLDRGTKSGFEAMNHALKARAEGGQIRADSGAEPTG